MKKRIFSILLAVVMVLSFAVPVFAADGVNSDEEAVLKEFSAVLKDYSKDLGSKNVTLLEKSAELALASEEIDLDADACAEFSEAIKEVAEILEKADGNVTKSTVNKMVSAINSNKVVKDNKIKLSVTGNFENPVIKVTINGKEVVDSSAAVKEAGFDTTPLFVVAGALVAVLAAVVFVTGKNKLLANN